MIAMSDETRRGGGLRGETGALWTLEWSQSSGRAALRCLIAIAIPLVLGITLDSPESGAIAAGGALSVGFGSFERVRGSCAIPMLLACIGMGFSVLLGTLMGRSDA